MLHEKPSYVLAFEARKKELLEELKNKKEAASRKSEQKKETKSK